MSNRSTIAGLAASISAYVALWLLVPRAEFIPAYMEAVRHAPGFAGNLLAAMGPVVVTAVFMLVQIGIIFFFSRFRMNLWQTIAALIGCLLLTAAFTQLIVLKTGIAVHLKHWPTLREQLALLSLYFGPLRIPVTVMTMLFAGCIGYLVSLAIKDKNLLLPVVMFAAYIDFWTVTRGPVAHVMDKAPEVVGAVSAPIPQVGAGGFVPNTMVGPGDFLFMALVFALVHRFKMSGSRNFWFVYTTMTAGMLAVMLGLLSTLPALTVLAVGVVAANWGRFKLSKEEKISIAVVGVLLAASLPIAWALLRPTGH